MVRRVKAALVALLIATSIRPAPLAAHPGGLNSEGCHNNRKTGDYHCHRGSSPAPSAPRSERQSFATLRGAFRNCSEARAVGAAPVRRGDPEFGPHLDRDGDGVGCEPYRGR